MKDLFPKKDFQDSYRFGVKQSPMPFVIPSKLLVPNQVKDAVFPNSLKNGQTKSAINAGSIAIGGQITTIDNVGDLNEALRTLHTLGGGTVNLLPGIYVPYEDIVIYSNTKISGNTMRDTIIDFNGTGLQMTAAGTNVYTTGTLTSITSGVTVVGSGTAWLAHVTPLASELFLGNRWYLIAAVIDNTHLILAESYAGAPIAPGTAYRIAIPVNDISLEFLQLTGSTDTALDIIDVRSIDKNNVLLFDNNIGFRYENVSEIEESQVICVENASDGFQMVNCGFGNITGLQTSGNAGHGALLDNLRTMPFTFSSSTANGGDGYNCTDVVDAAFYVEVSANGGHGINGVDNLTTSFISTMFARANGGDGIHLTANCDRNTIGSGAVIEFNTGWGVEIANANCDGNTLVGVIYNSNGSGGLDDNGTGTVVIT